MQKFLPYLRIAFSATCLIACVLLIVLWVRSYWYEDSVWYTDRNIVVSGVLSIPGSIVFQHLQMSGTDKHGWNFKTKRVPTQIVSGWKWEHDPGHLSVPVPTWFLCGLVISFGVIPWLRWRFSLRTLLIATTLVAVVLGLIVWAQ